VTANLITGMAYSISLNQKCCLASNLKLLVTRNVGNCIRQGSAILSSPWIRHFSRKPEGALPLPEFGQRYTIDHYCLFFIFILFFWTNRTFIQHLLNIKSLELQVYKHEEAIELSPKQGQISVTHGAIVD